MTQGIWWILCSLSIVFALAFIFWGIRSKRFRVLAAIGLVIALTAGGYSGWNIKFAHDKKAKALDDYYAGLDEIARGNIEEGKRKITQAVSIDPGIPGAKGKLRELGSPKKVKQRENRLNLQPTPGTSPGVKPRRLYHKPSDIQIDNYNLQAKIDPEAHTLSAVANITISARKETPTADFALGTAFKVDSISAGPQKIAFDRRKNLLSLKDSLRQGEFRTYRIAYRLEKPMMILPAGDMLSENGSYLRSESRWYPGTGELDFHSPVNAALTVPKGYSAISVGSLVGKDVSGDKTTFRWRSRAPVRMISAVIAKYSTKSDGTSKPQVSVYLYPKDQKQANAYLARAKSILSFYSRLYGPYPYDKLAIAEIPAFFPGGYGSPTLIMLTETSFRDPVFPTLFVSHELAHQWWGNALCPKGLGAGWMSEAFAQYSSYLYRDFVSGGKTLRKDVQKAFSDYLLQTSRGGEVPIAQSDPYDQEGAYSAVIYLRGACILHMLRYVMGDDAFFTTLREFVDENRGKRVSIQDFQFACEKKYGHSLDWFFKEWLNYTGTMKFAYNYNVEGPEGDRFPVTLTVSQQTRPYRMPVEIVLRTQSGISRRTIWVRNKTDRFTFELDSPLVSVDFDPDGRLMLPTPRRLPDLK